MVAAGPDPGRANTFEAAGDDHHLWVTRNLDERQLVLLHLSGDPASHDLHLALRLNGHVLRGGMAAAEGQAWLVYEDLTVQSIRPGQDSRQQAPTYECRYADPLPSGAALAGLAAGKGTLWALVRVQNPAAPAEAGPATDTATVLVESVDTAAAAPGLHRLLRLAEEGWESVDLPDDWPHPASAWVVFGRQTDPRPWLITAPARPGGRDLHYYQPVAERWQRHDAALPGGGPVRVAAINGRVVLASRGPDAGRLAIELRLLRPEAVSTLGAIAIPGMTGPAWSLVSLAGPYPLGVLALGDDGLLNMAKMDWEGQSTPAAALTEHGPAPLIGAVDQLVLIVALTVATVIMFAFWRRDPDWNRLALPDGLMVVDLTRRVLAGAIDLAPGFAVAYVWFGVGPSALLQQHWPGHRSGSFEAMVPGAIAIGVFVLHSTIGELFTARTLGKRVLGLQVATLRGDRPRAVSVLGRNAMKAVELVAWFLLVLPAMSPSRQRLGDLLARTVVVTTVDTGKDGSSQGGGP